MSTKYLIVLQDGERIASQGPYKDTKAMLRAARRIRAKSRQHKVYELCMISGVPFVNYYGKEVE